MIECCDHFVKQTYRNRCIIATTNGLQALSVPVERFDTSKCIMRDVRISDHGNWRHIHWNALQSAYSESPFFEYYQDDIRPFFEKKWDYLFDFNIAICHVLCDLIDIHPSVRFTENYITDTSLYDDYRERINPKHPILDDFVERKYYQVYDRKIGFQANLSILDLLFNMGPESIFYL